MLVFGAVIALAAAARSTWSPCGLSMLSQLTPLGEAGRGQKYPRTAAWFVAGAIAGGCTLGVVMALGAVVVGAFGLELHTVLALTAIGALAAAAVDADVFGFAPPWLQRQVNEAWLSQLRPWVYAGGFGWQIGAGVTTYVMTAAVPLLIVVGALGGSPALAFVLGALFGLVRGLAVLLGAGIRTPDALYAAHRRFDAWTRPVRDAVIVVLLVVAVEAASIVAPSLAIVVLVAIAAQGVLRRGARSSSSERSASPAAHSDAVASISSSNPP
jgi:hypothetical protein